MDGKTISRFQFTATLAAEPFSLLFHTPHRRILNVKTPKGHPILFTSDVLAAETNQGMMITTFVAWHTLVGILPVGSHIFLKFEEEEQSVKCDSIQISWDETQHDALALIVRDQFWTLAFGSSMDEAKKRAEQPLVSELSFEDILFTTIDERLSRHRALPELRDSKKDQLLKKCFSVMKVNTLYPEGANPVYWSTPDRVPHQHMWLWDSVFHTFGMNHIEPELSWAMLKAVLERQLMDGMIPHMMHVDGTTSQITQPPVLAWGVWENYQLLQNQEQLTYALPIVERYLEWNLTHRDINHNHLLEWQISGNPLSRSGESGMDNSQRFDDAVNLDAVDFSTFQALDMTYAALIAAELGEMDRAKLWRTRADQMSTMIHSYLWNAENNFYFDRGLDGRLSDVKAVSGFLPLLLHNIPDTHIVGLVKNLNNPTLFNTIFPIPSVSADTPTWSTDMWRGATWINMNFLVMLGLDRHGLHNEAAVLREKTIHFVEKYYQQYGVVFEFYDAKDSLPPVACDRKGQREEPYNIRNKMDSIRDYHWTAALVTHMLLQD